MTKTHEKPDDLQEDGNHAVPAAFWFFLVDQKELAAETVDQQKCEM